MTVATARDAAVDADLARREEVIERGLRTFLDVGRELTVIRAQRLYYQDFETFEDYCQERWDFDVRHAQRLMVAAATVEAIEQARPNGRTPLPVTESQARALTGLTPEVAAEVMTKAHEDTPAGKKVTAEAISEAREQVAPKPTPAKTEPKPEPSDAMREAEAQAIFQEMPHFNIRGRNPLRYGHLPHSDHESFFATGLHDCSESTFLPDTTSAA